MVLFDEENCVVYCSCGCGKGAVIKLEKEECEEGYCYLSLVSDMYSTMQTSIWFRFKEKCRRIWHIICDKEYTYFDICLNKEDAKKFKTFMNGGIKDNV